MSTLNDLKDRLKEINLKDFAETHYGASFKQEGNLFYSNCCLPGHSEKTPSLTYYPDTNTLTCFGCEEIRGGDIITFVGIMEKLETNGEEFIKIIKIICSKENIHFPVNNKPVDPEIEKILEHKTRCSILYRDNLWKDKNSYAFNYLLERGLTEQTIRVFNLGLTSEHESRYGRPGISNRISIPIPNSKGDRVIATSFRQLSGSENERKYIHDSNDKVFQKREVFYGYSHAIEHIKKLKHVYIVEGYFDMISLYQAGMKNTLACMSNRMTEEQINILSKITKNVIIILDQDIAGDKGFKETLPIMLNAGLNVRVVPSLKFMGKDANDLCIKMNWDNSSIQAFLNTNAKDAIQYLLSGVLDTYDDKVMQLRYVALSSTSSLLNCIQDPIKRKNYELYINGRLNI